jgi:S-formylglutathione hydrolase FrmB
MLHGFGETDELWMGFKPNWINLPHVVDKSVAGGNVREMIVVMPNAYNRLQGSMYSNSTTTGNWEDFIAEELVEYIDSHYRTFPTPASRGIAGHAMGGYGAARIGIKHPDVFCCIYLLSPWGVTADSEGDVPPKAAAVHNLAEFDQADVLVRQYLAAAAAWSPNPAKPPLFLDLPAQGAPIQAKWTANSLLALVEQYGASVRRLKAFAFDAGKQDKEIAAEAKQFDIALTKGTIPHTFELYDGDRTNKVASRIENKMLPFFNKNLKFTK